MKVFRTILLAILLAITGYHAAAQCNISTLPWQENFDSLTSNGLRPACWRVFRSQTYNSINYPRITTVDSLTCIRLSGSNSNRCVIGMPIITASTQWISLHFKAKAQNNGGIRKLIIGPGTDTQIDTMAVFSNPSFSWTEYEVFVPATSFTGRNIVFIYYCSSTNISLPLINIADIRVEAEPSCRPPRPGSISNITTDSVTLSWTPRCNIATAYGVRITDEDSVISIDTIVADSITSISLGGLTEHTHYYAYVHTVCDTVTDNWLLLGDFLTERHCHASTINVTQLGADMAIVRWTPSNVGDSTTSVVVTCLDMTDTSANPQTLQFAASPGYIPGLHAGHTYRFLVRTLCDIWYEDGDTLTLTMDSVAPCELVNLPYTNNFNSLVPYISSSSSYDELPPCWYNSYTGTNTANRRLVSQHYGNICIEINTATSDAISTPLINAQGQPLRILFYYTKGNSAGNFEVGMMTDPSDRTTFITVGVLNGMRGDLDWHEAEFFVTPQDSRPVSVAFRRTTSSGYAIFYIDSLLIETATDCRRPASATVDNITDATARVHWVPQGTHNNNFEVRYCIEDSIYNYQYTSVSDTHIQIFLPMADTSYHIWVRNMCDTAMSRPWLYGGTFRTERSCYPLTNALVMQENNGYIGITWTFDESHHRQATDVLVRWYPDSDTFLTQTMVVRAIYRSAFIGPLIPDSSYTIELTTLCNADNAEAIVIHHTAQQSPVYRPLLIVETLDSTSVRAMWYGNNTSSHRLCYCNRSDGVWTSFNVTDNPVTISGLNPSTTYNFCLIELSGTPIYSDTIVASTSCGLLHLPYHALFDGTMPKCWTMAVASNTHTTPEPNFAIGANGVAVMPEIDEDAARVQVHLSFTKRGGSTGTLQVGLSTSPTDTSSIVWLHAISYNGPNNSQYDTILSLEEYSGTGRQIAFKVTGSPIFIINRLDIEHLNPCQRVNIIHLDSVDATMAQLSWRSTGALQYRVILSHDGISDTLVANDTVFTLTGIQPTTNYAVRIFSMCDTDNVSLSSTMLVFRTPCNTYAYLPLIETFNTTTRMPECWTAVTDEVISNTNLPRIYNRVLLLKKVNSDSVGCIAASPMIPTPLMHVSFRAYAYNVHGASIGLMSDLSDLSTYVPILALPNVIPAGTIYEFATDTLNSLDTNAHYHLVFRIATGQLEIDDVQVNALDYCRKPQYGTIDESTTHSITANWRTTGADTYRVLCISDSNSIDTITQNTSITFTNLSPATRYWIYVSSICGSDTTEFLALGNVRTDCDLYTLPYQNDFESLPLRSYPPCWEIVGNETSDVNSVNVDLDNYSNHVLYIDYGYAITPRFVVPTQGIHVSFRARSYFDPSQTESGGLMRCYSAYVRNERVILDSTKILRYDTLMSINAYHFFSFNCTEYQPGDTIVVAIWGNSFPQNIKIDDIRIDTIPPDTLWRTVSVNCDSTMGIVTGGGVYLDSSIVTISAIPISPSEPNTHIEFDRWDDGDTSNPREVFVVSDTVLNALFRVINDTLWRIVSVNCDSTMGTVSGGGQYVDSSFVTLTATPNNGYHFTHWQDGNTTNPRQVLVTIDTTFTAYFSVDSLPPTPPVPDTVWRTVTVLSADDGLGEVTGGGVYPDSSWVTIAAYPLAPDSANLLYEFDHWNDGDTVNPRQIFVTSDTTFTAYFSVDSVPPTPPVGIGDVHPPVLEVYPNPSHGKITVTLNTTAYLTVTDITGRRVLPPTKTDTSIQLSLPRGIYFIHAATETGTTIKKFIIE